MSGSHVEIVWQFNLNSNLFFSLSKKKKNAFCSIHPKHFSPSHLSDCVFLSLPLVCLSVSPARPPTHMYTVILFCRMLLETAYKLGLTFVPYRNINYHDFVPFFI